MTMDSLIQHLGHAWQGPVSSITSSTKHGFMRQEGVSLLLCEKACMACAWYDWFCNTLWKESLYSDGHQFHQYQQNEQ